MVGETFEVWDIEGMLEKARSIPMCQYVGSWERKGEFMKDKKESLDPREMSKRVEGKAGKLRGIEINIRGEKETINKYKDKAFLEMPHFLIEDDDGRRAPFLRVVTEKGSYRIKLEKI